MKVKVKEKVKVKVKVPRGASGTVFWFRNRFLFAPEPFFGSGRFLGSGEHCHLPKSILAAPLRDGYSIIFVSP